MNEINNRKEYLGAKITSSKTIAIAVEVGKTNANPAQTGTIIAMTLDQSPAPAPANLWEE